MPRIEDEEKTQGDEKQLEHYLSLLEICSRGYWCDERRLYKLESALPAGPFRGLMIPTGRILNGISILISGTTAQEEVDAAAVSAVAVKNANQPPKDPGVLATAL